MRRYEIDALAYRVLCSFAKRWITMLILLIIPIFFGYFFIQSKIPKDTEKPRFETIKTKIHDIETKSNFLYRQYESFNFILAVSPNNTDIKNLMDSATSRLRVESLMYMEKAEDVSKYMNELFKKDGKIRLHRVKELFGVNFETLTRENLIYTIRSYECRNTAERFPKEMRRGPMYNDCGYYKSGFLGLQMSIDDAYLGIYLETSIPDTLGFQGFPYPAYKDYNNTKTESQVSKYKETASLIIFCIIFMLAKFASLIIQEKASGIREILKINGVKMWLIYSNLFIPFVLITTVIAATLTALCKTPFDNEVTFLPNTDSFILLLILLIFFWSSLCSVAFISSLISSPKFGMLIIILYWFLSQFIVDYLQDMLSRTNVILVVLSMLPIGGFSICFDAIAAYETNDRELTFSELFTVPQDTQNNLPVGITLLTMMISMIIYLALMMYIDAIKPGQYGRAEPWYFILPFRKNRANNTPSKPNQVLSKETNVETEPDAHAEKKNEKRKPDKESDLEGIQTSQIISHSTLIEPVNQEATIGIKTEKLVKTFGNFKAVDNLTITMLKNEITVLLGHNGAGKTTFFSMVCGMFSPTSGDVLTENYNVFKGQNMDVFRKELGYCPQYNLLLNDMTVEQHLIFFGMLKGLKYSDAKMESDQRTTQFKIDDSRHKRPHKLSGGMKRKLCLSIAMVGKPKFLLLDEPTSGLDPESRRDVWNVLLRARGTTTTVITTHYMEEADVLADRIAIIVHGKLKCYGTTVFLKQHYGVGYLLNCTAQSKDADQLLAMVQRYVSSAQLVSKTDRTFLISLPASEVKKFPALLQAIGKQADITLSYSTMDDVFLRVQEDEGVHTTVIEMPKEEEKRKPQQEFALQQKALFVKRIQWLYHNWKLYIFMMIMLPVATIFLAVNRSEYILFFESGKIVNLSLTLDAYEGGRGVVAKESSDDRVAAFVESAMTNNGLSYKNIAPSENIINFLLSLASKDLLDYRMNEIVAFDTRGKLTALYSTLAYHSLPIAYGVLVNAKINDLNSTIRTYNFPSIIDTKTCPRSNNIVNTYIFAMWIITFVFAMLIATSYFVLFPHTERVTGIKHLQLMTGVWPLFYWLPILIVDLIIFVSAIALVMIALIISDSYNLFNSQIVLQVLSLGLILYGISSILLTYVCSFSFKKYSTAMQLYIFVSLFATLATFIVSLFRPGEWKMEYIYFLPWAILSVYLQKVIEWSIKASQCKMCRENPYSVNCDAITKNVSLETFKLNYEIKFFVIDMLIYSLLILCLDHGLWRIIKAFVKSIVYGEIKYDHDASNPDVANEKERIRTIGKKNEDQTDEAPIFICDSLGKKYSRNRTAVYDVTFGVKQGECFGLLGTNGAGKSTTFGMLTALIIPTKGTAKIMEHRLTWCGNYKYLKNLGYCPQLGGLLLELSARSLITLFGLLRGVPSSQIKTLTKKWIDALEMGAICDRPCKNYSGGNKRKLSTAIAMIGDPPLVLLDEPTTGVDPVIRRKIWGILRYCMETNKQTIILTSHSMDECEAVCGRITIMVNGAMKCIGPIPSLKKLYGKGCVLQVKLVVTSSESQIDNTQTQIESKFTPYIKLQNKQSSLLSFYISSETIKIHEMFEVMLGIKSTNQNIEDFNLSDITLEQVFLLFTKNENERSQQPKTPPSGSQSNKL